MTQGERVKKVRQSLSLTMEKFAEGLGVGKTAISKIESNERGLTGQMAKAICNVYNVNYEWLTNDGDSGEMFNPEPETALDELAEERQLSHQDRVLLESFLALSSAERDAIVKYALKVAEALKEESAEEKKKNG